MTCSTWDLLQRHGYRSGIENQQFLIQAGPQEGFHQGQPGLKKCSKEALVLSILIHLDVFF